MITRKKLLEKLGEMHSTDVIARHSDYRSTHHLCSTPLQKGLCNLLGVKKVEAKTYTAKNGVEKCAPIWLVKTHKTLATLIYHGCDINVRTVMSVINQTK